ncbi:hypothetical protein LZY01_23720 [Levilactobacillus zymae]|uniref:Single-stranded DNA-binding protein n=1 Tax=Levilactobacillus zymae TaxID=267363 RepID=A0ABQ0WZE0_9LACO|nr:ERF family protein [Levilactobacillus zymae]KRL07890.1 Erf family protein [Levilactobacillus zymae DSM 19395]QFR61039.1 hypothetical protein LZ395_05640 [Levilactobacillus zymae]GEO73204.1 hypothetical protein LZY01_23720 [Levilactobacillus zymae]
MEKSDSIKEIAKALHEFRTKVKQPKKEAKNPFFKKNYVDLEGVQKAIDDALPEGLSWGQEATSNERTVSVSTFILHSSGEFIIFAPLTIPANKQDAQQFGSAETYARRYSLSAAFGISSDIDDDGERASQHQQNNQQNRRQSNPRGQRQQSNGTQQGRGQNQSRNAGTQAQSDPSTAAQRTELMKLFKNVAETTGNPLASVQNYYLGQFKVNNIAQLSSLQADEIAVVVKQKLNGGKHD